MGVVVVKGKHRAIPNRRMWWQTREALQHLWFYWRKEVKADWVELRHDYRVWLKERGNMCPECDRWRSAGREVGRKLGVVQERNRLLDLLIHADTTSLSDEAMAGWYFAVQLINGENK